MFLHPVLFLSGDGIYHLDRYHVPGTLSVMTAANGTIIYFLLILFLRSVRFYTRRPFLFL